MTPRGAAAWRGRGASVSGRPWRVAQRAVLVAAMLVLVSGTAWAQAPPEAIEYYARDGAGSVRIVFDAQGNVLGRSDYLPFGETWNQSGALPRQRFTGQARDGEAGLDDFNARAYQPLFGRFTRPDPVYGNVFEPQSWNAYAYVNNRQLVLVDPSGLVDVPAGGFFGGRFSGTSGGCPGCPKGGERAAPGSSDPLSFDMWVLWNTFFPTSWQQGDPRPQRDRPQPRGPKTPDPKKPDGGNGDGNGDGGSNQSTAQQEQVKKSEDDKIPEKPYADCVMVCVEQERFNPLAVFSTLSAQFGLGTMPKAASEIPGALGSTRWTSQPSRWTLRGADRAWREFGRTGLGRAIGGAALVGTVFEGYYDIGAIVRCCTVCGMDSKRY